MARKTDLEKNTKAVAAPSVYPDAPDDLTVHQAALWHQFFRNVEQGWIEPIQYHLVEAYVRHVTSAQRVAELIERHDQAVAKKDDVIFDDVAMSDKLRKMQDREHRAITAILTKLRLTIQSLRRPTEGNPASFQKPWEDDE